MSNGQAEIYRAFMAGYVKRINDATFRVPVGGVRIGSAKYSRLAQINLRTHIITFSRYAIEGVPERGRRYLVIHELAHVIEPSHNKDFWSLVAAHEPRYKEIGRELEEAFHKNVRADLHRTDSGTLYQHRLFQSSDSFDWWSSGESLDESPDALLRDGTSDEIWERMGIEPSNPGLIYPMDSGVIREAEPDFFTCNDFDFASWDELQPGVMQAGADTADGLDDDFLDHF